MLPQMPSVMNNRNDPMPRVSQRIVAFSVHIKCDGTSENIFVIASKQSVERGLRPPTTTNEVQNVKEGKVQLWLGYGFDLEEDRLTYKIDQDTILGAWVTEEGETQVYKARLTKNGFFRDGGTTMYDIELEHPNIPGRYVPFRQKVGVKVVTLTIVFHQ